MIHPKTELKFISQEIGYGVVATEFIPAGTITWALDQLDREFTPEMFNAMDSIYKTILDTYSYRNNKGNFVLCWDNGRFVNHSFNSNCLTTAYDFEIAVRDILPGEQLTDDYGYLNISEPFEAFDEGTERKIVFPDDLVNYHNIWDLQIKSVFNKILDNEQPLQPLIKNDLWLKINRIAKGEEEMDSILKNYYSERK
ncbi:SET domain-containing protein [Winogradskyella wichelsiae]|uniref:SET domain-containing protein n=1 Tax=Winogradskyella wichelsiae TaxID=2697007 RepID=UPI0015CD943D|nr:SET domain-containing protein [Winogradskyella wichelsiae]